MSGHGQMNDKPIFDTERLIPTYFKLALPVVFSMVITLIYNLADTYFIGRTNDAMLVAGVSLCAPLFTVLSAAVLSALPAPQAHSRTITSRTSTTGHTTNHATGILFFCALLILRYTSFCFFKLCGEPSLV